MSETARWALPLLEAGQAQKEMTHNEALAVLDLLQGASVEQVGLDTPPPSPTTGQCWVIGSTPTGAWAGRAGALAGWTAGGWRFVGPREGMAVWSHSDGCSATYAAGAWRIGRLIGTEVVIGGLSVIGARRAAVAAPAGGGVVDGEARAAIGVLIATMAGHGLIAA